MTSYRVYVLKKIQMNIYLGSHGREGMNCLQNSRDYAARMRCCSELREVNAYIKRMKLMSVDSSYGMRAIFAKYAYLANFRGLNARPLLGSGRTDQRELLLCVIL